MNTAGLDEILRQIFGDDIATAIKEVAVVADFEMSEEYNRPFVEIINWINTRPAFIATWRNDPATERKDYLRFMGGLEASRDALRASVYRLERIRELEDALHSTLRRFDFSKSVPPGSVAAFGNTRRWGFEYQAFVLDYRRGLDGLAWGVSTYFKQQQSSFKSFAKALPKYHPTPVATSLATVCAQYIDKFDFVIGSERGQSVRDRIAHRESVQAGFINVDASGYRIVGGGEQLGIEDFNDQRRLAGVLQARLDALKHCIADILQTFRTAVTNYEAAAR